MEEGYLIIETNPEHPGLVRIRRAQKAPAAPDQGPRTGPRLRYAARFGDLRAAQMHTHARLRRRLVDIDAGLYRCDPVTAIAAAQSIALRHRQVYLDPGLAADQSLSGSVAKHRWRHKLAERFWQVVGIIAVIFLLIKTLFGF
jgi:hypothetical protein